MILSVAIFTTMPRNFTKQIFFDGKTAVAAILPEVRKDGTYYEVNIKGYPRFFMKWSQLGRYDVTGSGKLNLPYSLILAVSDAIEEENSKDGN
jgi:hypothetical protein